MAESVQKPVDTPKAKNKSAKDGVIFVRESVRDVNDLSATVVREAARRATQRVTENLFGSEEGENLDCLPFDGRLTTVLRDRMAITRYTAVQLAAAPLAIDGTSIFIQSETGSGKTLAFLLPLIHRLIEQGRTTPITREQGTRLLILTPTRELAIQTESVLSQLCRALPWLVHACLAGGANAKSEKASLRRGVVALVATPGRLLYHLTKTASFKVNNLQMLVLDESDAMLSAHANAVAEIIDAIESRTGKKVAELQTVLCSATHGAAVADLAARVQPHGQPVVMSSTAASLANFTTAKPKSRKKPEPAAATTGAVAVGGEEHLSDLPAESRLVHGIEIDASSSSSEGSGLGSDSEEESEREFEMPHDDAADDAAAAAVAAAVAAAAAGGADATEAATLAPVTMTAAAARAALPAALDLAFCVVPTKMRLMALAGLIVHEAARIGQDLGRPARFLVFVASMDAVVWTTAALQHLTTANPLPGQVQPTPVPVEQRLLPCHFGAIHGSMTVQQRIAAARDFAAPLPALETGADARAALAASQVLVVTDVAARGLDFGGQAVDMVIQLDAPADFEHFIHRCGRAGRIGRAGQAVSFLHPSEAQFVVALAHAGIVMAPLDADAVLAGVFTAWPAHVPHPRGGHTLERVAGIQNRLIKLVEAQAAPAAAAGDDDEVAPSGFMHTAALRAFQTTVGAYKVRHRELRPYFPFKEVHMGHLAASFCLSTDPTALLHQRSDCRTQGGLAIRKAEKQRSIRESGQARREEWLMRNARHVSRKAHKAKMGTKVSTDQNRDFRMVGTGAVVQAKKPNNKKHFY